MFDGPAVRWGPEQDVWESHIKRLFIRANLAALLFVRLITSSGSLAAFMPLLCLLLSLSISFIQEHVQHGHMGVYTLWSPLYSQREK